MLNNIFNFSRYLIFYEFECVYIFLKASIATNKIHFIKIKEASETFKIVFFFHYGFRVF